MTKTINLDDHIETVARIIELREDRAKIKDELDEVEELIHGILDNEDATEGTIWGEVIFTVSKRKGKLSLDKAAIAAELGLDNLSLYESRGKPSRVHNVSKNAAETLALVGDLVRGEALTDLH